MKTNQVGTFYRRTVLILIVALGLTLSACIKVGSDEEEYRHAIKMSERATSRSDAESYLKGYLSAYPTGKYADLVKLRLEQQEFRWKSIETTKNRMEELRKAIAVFNYDTGEPLKTEQYPNALWKNPGVRNWRGPYLRDAGCTVDAWGRDIMYRGEKLVSVGPDRRFDTPDDIVVSVK